MFAMSIGGDGSPSIGGTAFLLSFLNVGKRRLSSTENFLLFGADCDEGSVIVQNYVRDLMLDVCFLESKVNDCKS